MLGLPDVVWWLIVAESPLLYLGLMAGLQNLARALFGEEFSEDLDEVLGMPLLLLVWLCLLAVFLVPGVVAKLVLLLCDGFDRLRPHRPLSILITP